VSRRDRSDEATIVRWFVLMLAVVVTVPLVVPRRRFRLALGATTVLLASFVVVSIVRLGVLYAPAFALQLVALWPVCSARRSS